MFVRVLVKETNTASKNVYAVPKQVGHENHTAFPQLFCSEIRALPKLHTDLFCRQSSFQKFIFLWRSTKDVKMLRPTGFAIDATEDSKERGVAAEMFSSQTEL